MLDWMIHYFRQLTDYNSGANIRLYDAYAVLSDAELQRDRKRSFNSIHGTLNQILVGGRIWMAQFTGGVAPAIDLVRELNALRSARFAEDDQISEFIERLDANFPEGKIVYVKNESRMLKDTRHPLLAHFFNHQTHRRGQVHCMLSQAGVATPILDIHQVINP
tara:strand:- start:44 stop:532 length:489 start_codon:yes stop_codon:yes gene_type:complete